MVRWFHRDLSGLDAETLLKGRGVNGSFLARPSRKNQGDFSLSVRVGDQVTHIRIQNSGDFYDLYGGEKFATLTELVEYYTQQQGVLQDRDGTIIHLKYPLNCSDPTSERWYHGHMSGGQAETLLQAKGEPWTFLVRESLSQPGDFVLSVLSDQPKAGLGSPLRVTHIKVMCEGGRYTVGGLETFDSLTDLVEHFKRTGIEEASGAFVYLRQPYYATRVNAADIENRVLELNKKQESEDTAKAGFWEEFESLQKQEVKNSHQRLEGQRPENKSKNRYKNILPFDHSRVVLQGRDSNIPGSDYINANYVKNQLLGSDENAKTYIASQGCLEATVNDFWQMVWQENTRVIVMTTREVEKGRNKCIPYWPEVGTQRVYGVYAVTNCGEHDTPEYKLRTLQVSPLDNGDLVREIWHYQYLSWPDHGVPSEPGGVLSFLDQINQRQESLPHAGPIIVHCSPGQQAEASSLLQPISPFPPVPPTQALGSCTTSSTGDPHVHDQETPFLLRWEAEGSARRSRCPIRPEGQRPADGPTQPAWPGGMGGSWHRVLGRRCCSTFQLLHSLAVRSWAKDLPSLTPGFLVHKIRVL
ncbi:tyrosine-protein phosphatase non-receptor type 6 isoform X2 [Physeter macrocephalus]|uniref:protein-tyrosine-phosphatase n=1 Tax=Physeter macrocephalus TaxID=9755 RepID=A0A455ATM7_PHYMC|nr:tyrosine-protein phosphatase non-receptor type 6 isoform X2 [Physeter catodon]|eukprot:XP_028339484.1 tyrosine-protein phosphatase non-receptor type 6 isoform X2 [Physeter catodon]